MPDGGLHPVEQETEKLPNAAEVSASPYVRSEAHRQAQFSTPPRHLQQQQQQQFLPTSEFPKPMPGNPYMAYPSSSQLPAASSHSSPVPEKRIQGLRKTTLFLTLSNIFLLIVIILVGVLPSQLNKNQNTSGTCAESSGASNGGGSPTS